MKKGLCRLVASLLSVIMLNTSTVGSVFAAGSTEVKNETSMISTVSARSTSMYLGSVTFTGTNSGAWRTVPGNYARMCIAFKPIDGISYSTELSVDMYQYSSKYIGSLECTTYTTSPDSDGYYFFVSDYFKINPNSDCRLRYLATSSGTSFPVSCAN